MRIDIARSRRTGRPARSGQLAIGRQSWGDDRMLAADAHLATLRCEEAIAGYESILESRPDDFHALVGLGCALTKVGLGRQALIPLYRAAALRPPSWHAYQILSVWTRAAERDAEGSFVRKPGAPPRALVRALEWLARRKAAPDASGNLPRGGDLG